jgi:hypothetical protein
MVVKYASFKGLFIDKSNHLGVWTSEFDEEVKHLEFIQNKEEPCVYKMVSGSYALLLIMYIDQILLIGKFIFLIEHIKLHWKMLFSMKDLEEA